MDTLNVSEKMLAAARNFAGRKVDYDFTPREREALDRFCTNTDKKVFFLHTLPSAVIATLLSMYSRIKNKRGIRGHFVDNILPLLLLNFSSEFSAGAGSEGDLKESVDRMQRFLKEKKLATLDGFCAHSEEHEKLFREFLSRVNVDKKYLKDIASSPKVKLFFRLFLDKYGHNSIARTAQFVIGLENVSILAAKSVEWSRPGSAFIELSTRYVDMGNSGLYPVWKEIGAGFGPEAASVAEISIRSAFDRYCFEMGDETSDGSFDKFLTDKYGSSVPQDEMKMAVNGEKCDVMANILPVATTTSLGISMSGEELPELVKHLFLDATPENRALAEMIISEAEEVGASQFIRHLEISDWQRAGWRYLDAQLFKGGRSGIDRLVAPSREYAERALREAFDQVGREKPLENDFSSLIGELKGVGRGEYDKLPSQFEFVGAWGSGVISFRSWRDFQRMSFSTHLRTLITPLIGFYDYDKPAPARLRESYEKTYDENKRTYADLKDRGVPEEVIQYSMALGNLIGFQVGANLRQHEFCAWQRSKFSVNHEVRQAFLSIEKKLREIYPWWKEVSRADMTEAYVFARTKNGIPL
jgi:thymidylate synthase ThyX